MSTIAVVIPFYQRSQGILERSLKSVFAQDLPIGACLKIIIVDDQSPISLDDELASIAVHATHDIVALYRVNGGPGAARNTALDYLSANEIDFVAFLDSDDVWQPRHLADGLAALAEDGDFYFCDHERWHNPDSWFAASKLIAGWLGGLNEMVAPVRSSPDIFEFRSGRATLAFLVDYMAQTSTVIYRFEPFSRLRFDSTLRHAGEDHMFWLDLANGARAVRFSRRSNVSTGEGVNMYFSSAASWDHPDCARRIGANLLLLARLENRFGRVAYVRSIMRQRYWRIQKEFVWVWVRKILKTRSVDLDTMRPLVRERKSLLMTLPLAFLAAALRRPRAL